MGDAVFNREFETELMIKNEIEIRTLKGFNMNNPGFQPGDTNEKVNKAHSLQTIEKTSETMRHKAKRRLKNDKLKEYNLK